MKKKQASKPPAKKTRIRNPKQTRAKLLQATIDLVSDRGVEALSLKEAARIANVSRGVAYQHFDDRDHLLREAKMWISDQLLETIKEVNSSSMEESVNYVAKLVLNNREAAKLLVADALAGKDLSADHPLYNIILKVLEEFKASGKAGSRFDVEIMSFIMLGTVATLIMTSRLRKGDNVDDLAQRFTTEWTRILRDGLFAKSARRKKKSA